MADWVAHIGLLAEKHPGMWALIQAACTIAALWFAVLQPPLKERRDNLNRLKAYRNIAFFAYRVSSDILDDRKLGRPTIRNEVIFERCARALEDLDLTHLKPAYLIERLVDIQVQNDQVRAIINAHGDAQAPPHLNDPQFAKNIKSYAQHALSDLDSHLKKRRVRFNSEGVAM